MLACTAVMPDERETTLPSTSDGSDESDERLALVCIGSPERDFAHAGAVYRLSGVGRVRFGRSVDQKWDHGQRDGVVEIAVPLPWVSSVHAELHLDGPRLRIVDCGSRNGTLVENKRIGTQAGLSVGRVFEIGRSFWMLRRVRSTVDPTEPGQTPRFACNEVRTLQRVIARLAPSTVPILLYGETGTGKERLARAIHVRSGREGPFIPVNVAGSIERLLQGRAERLLAARGGTLYLDDVGELAPEDQTKLTSALMSHAHESREEGHDAQIRLVSSSTRDLRTMVEAGTFRPDLLGRLAGYEARLPPLRERREDLGLLAMDVLRRQAKGGPVPRLSSAVFRSMLEHPWPFNLRELEHSLMAARTLVEGEPGEIDLEIWKQVCWKVEGGDPSPSRVEAVRRELVQQLARHRGQLDAVAQALQCEVEDVQRWAERFSLRPERYRDAG